MSIDREIKIKETENNFKTLKIKYKELLWNLKKIVGVMMKQM